MFVLTATILVILLYGAASQCGDVDPLRTNTTKLTRFSGERSLVHVEASAQEWLLGSSTCDLGKIVWAAWAVVLIALLVFPRRRPWVRYLLLGLLLLTVSVTLLMNPPLAARSSPAWVALAFLIPLLA